jgi:hypothetical protein
VYYRVVDKEEGRSTKRARKTVERFQAIPSTQDSATIRNRKKGPAPRGKLAENFGSSVRLPIRKTDGGIEVETKKVCKLCSKTFKQDKLSKHMANHAKKEEERRAKAKKGELVKGQRLAYNFGKVGEQKMWYLSVLASNIIKPHIYNDSHPAGGHWYRVKSDHTLKNIDVQFEPKKEGELWKRVTDAEYPPPTKSASGEVKVHQEWAQCEGCSKWRMLPEGLMGWDGEFRCELNTWDKAHDSCKKAEVEYGEEDEYDLREQRQGGDGFTGKGPRDGKQTGKLSTGLKVKREMGAGRAVGKIDGGGRRAGGGTGGGSGGGGGAGGKFVCQVCDRSFENQVSLSRHKGHHTRAEEQGNSLGAGVGLGAGATIRSCDFEAGAGGGSSGSLVGGEDGKHRTGNWTDEEKAAFTRALAIHGADIAKLTEMIPTRSLTQCRTHARRLVEKENKNEGDSGDSARNKNEGAGEVRKKRQMSPQQVGRSKKLARMQLGRSKKVYVEQRRKQLWPRRIVPRCGADGALMAKNDHKVKLKRKAGGVRSPTNSNGSPHLRYGGSTASSNAEQPFFFEAFEGAGATITLFSRHAFYQQLYHYALKDEYRECDLM